MEVQLVVEKGGQKRVMRLKTPQAVVGRGRGNTIRIPSADVSREHCRLRIEGGLVEVEDLDSVNGTFINGARVRSWQVARPGDRLEVGPVAFTVEYELTPEALARLKKKGMPVNPAAGASVWQGLADGSIMEGEPMFDDLEILDDAAEAEGLPMLELDEVPIEADPAKPKFDFDQAWQLPEGTEFRDLLSQMDDTGPAQVASDDSGRKKKKKK